MYLPPSESTLQRSRPIAPPPTVVLIISTPIASNVRCSRNVFENSSLVTKLHPPSCLNCTPHAAPPSQHLYPHSHNLHPHASPALPRSAPAPPTFPSCTPQAAPKPLRLQAPPLASEKSFILPTSNHHPPFFLCRALHL